MLAIVSLLILLGGIFNFIDWLSPIRRFVRRHHGIDLEDPLNGESNVYYLARIAEGAPVLQMKLRTLVRIPHDQLPLRWVIPIDEGKPFETRYLIRARYWAFGNNDSLASEISLTDACGNELWIGSKNSTAATIAEKIIRLDTRYENVHHLHLQLFRKFVQEKVRIALKATKSVPVQQIEAVLSQVPSPGTSTHIPDFEFWAEHLYPSKPPEHKVEA